MLLMYYINIMSEKRYIFDRVGADSRFEIEVIGLHCRRDDFYEGTGIPAYRIMMFHAPMRIVRRDLIETTEPETLYIFPENEPVCYGSINGSPWEHSWIRLKGVDAVNSIVAAGIPLNSPVKFDDCRESDKWLELIVEEMSRTQVDLDSVRLLLDIWLNKIKTRCGNVNHIPPGIRAAKKAIEADFTTKLTLNKLASIACMSPPYFCEEFKKYFKVSPIDYVIRLRLKNAAMLLEDKSQSISEVASGSGYDDVYYFSKLFKKRYGVSPSTYRNN